MAIEGLREALSAAIDKAGTGENGSDAGQSFQSTGDQSQAGEGAGQDQAASDRARDESGRFVKQGDQANSGRDGKTAAADGKDRTRPTLTLKNGLIRRQQAAAQGTGGKDAAPQQERTPEVAANPPDADQGQASGASQAIAAPQHWNGSGKVAWAALPPDVQQEIAKEYQQLAPIREVAPAIQPFAQALQQRFGNVGQGLGAVLSTWQYALTKPVDFLRQFCQQFGIDPQSLIGASSGTAVPAQGGNAGPQYVTADDLNAAVNRAQADAQERFFSQQIQTEIGQFGSKVNADGSLAHPYFNDVREVMGALMAKGQAETLEQAYAEAVYALPHARAALLKQQQDKEAAERKKAADAARQASVSVTGAPGITRVNGSQPKTVRDSLLSAYEKATEGPRI